MPDALKTTKRKFHKLLDTINAASNSFPPSEGDASSAKPPVTLLTARERLDAASERAKKRLRLSPSRTSFAPSLSSDLDRKYSTPPSSLSRKVLTLHATPGGKDDDKELPNFSPWAHVQFLERLKTFSKVSMWHPKPAAIGEIQWAKRGWQCVDVNTVACRGGCERRVVVKLDWVAKGGVHAAEDSDEEEDEAEAGELEEAMVQRYEREMVDGHASHCMWRKAGCKDDIYRLSLVRPVVWQPALRKRYISLLDISDSIKNVTFRSLPRDDPALLAPDRLIAELPPNVLSSPNADTSLKVTALDIALHGWRGDTELDINLLHCDSCFQRIGLWMYQPGYTPGRGILAAADGDGVEPEKVSVNLLEMHRLHCPWQNAGSQAARGTFETMNACQILNRVVSTYAREQRRRSERQEKDAEEEVTGNDDAVGEDYGTVVKHSPAEIEQMDRERESKLKKLKRMFTISRSNKAVSR